MHADSQPQHSPALPGALLAVIASQWCEPIESPKSNYLHPICLALGRIITLRCAELPISRTKAARAAKIAVSALGKVEHADGWYSLNVAARACEAAGINFARAIVDAVIECQREQENEKAPTGGTQAKAKRVAKEGNTPALQRKRGKGEDAARCPRSTGSAKKPS